MPKLKYFEILVCDCGQHWEIKRNGYGTKVKRFNNVNPEHKFRVETI